MNRSSSLLRKPEEDIIYGEPPSKWQYFKRKIFDTITKAFEEHPHGEGVHAPVSAFDGNRFAMGKLILVIIIMIVCCGLIFSQHEGESHESSLLITKSNPAFLALEGRLKMMRLKFSVAPSEAVQVNETGMLIVDYETQQVEETANIHHFKTRSADHIGEDEQYEGNVIRVYNVSIIILGKVDLQDNVWEIFHPPQYLELSEDPEENIAANIYLSSEEINKYKSKFLLRIGIVDNTTQPSNSSDSSSASSSGSDSVEYSYTSLEYEGSLTSSSSSSSSSGEGGTDLIYQYITDPFVLDFEIIYMPPAGDYEVAIAFIILLMVYSMIVFELFHRTIAGLLGSFMTVSALSFLQNRPTFHEIVDWIDFDTIGVLFGMMIMVGILSTTGVFEYCAVKAYKFSKGNIWRLTLLLCVFTGSVSAFLDNVTTILLIAPVTLRLCEVLSISPINMLLLEVMFSNIGGTATPIGDPPNIIIVSDRRVQAAGIADFLSFTVHITPGIILSMVSCLWYAKRFQFNHQECKNSDIAAALRQKELSIWRKAAGNIAGENEEEVHVKKQLEEYVATLEAANLEASKSEPSSHEEFVADLEAKYSIHNMRLFRISATVMGLVILMFFGHSITHVPLVWVSIVGSMILLVVAEVHDIDKALEKVEISTLLFFAALFIIMRGMEEMGLIEYIGETTAGIIRGVPPGNGRLAVAIVLILWVSSFVSAFIDNIPYTTTMIPVVVKLATDNLGLPLAPLLWALVYGACLGGNGTIIGASANVVAAGIAEAHGHHISYFRFLKTGLPTMIMSSLVCTIYLLITHVWLGWY